MTSLCPGSPVLPLNQPALSSTVLSDDTSRDLGSWIAGVLLPFLLSFFVFVFVLLKLFSLLRAQILHDFPHFSYRLQLVGDRFDPSERDYLKVRTTLRPPCGN